MGNPPQNGGLFWRFHLEMVHFPARHVWVPEATLLWVSPTLRHIFGHVWTYSLGITINFGGRFLSLFIRVESRFWPPENDFREEKVWSKIATGAMSIKEWRWHANSKVAHSTAPQFHTIYNPNNFTYSRIVYKHGNTPPQYSEKMDQNWAFDLVLTVFCV